MTQPVADVHDLTADRDGERLDLFIARRLSDLTRSRVRKLIDGGAVSINGQTPRNVAGLEFSNVRSTAP